MEIKIELLTPLNIGSLLRITDRAYWFNDIFSLISRYLFSGDLPDKRLLMIDLLEYRSLIFIDQIIRIPDKLEFLLISESEIIPKVLFKIID